jgi:hypothetical protein
MVTSSKVGVSDVSEVVKVARHCRYLPEGNPEVTGEVPPTKVHEGVVAFLANEVFEALTSKVMSVLLGSVSSQNRAFQVAPATPVSKT